jgi:hypothetical protein
MKINEEEAKIIIESIEQCQNINGFIDEQEKDLLIKIRFEFPHLKYYHINL